MSCGVDCRCGSDLALLWLWHRPAAVAPIRPLAWEPPCVVGTVLKTTTKNLGDTGKAFLRGKFIAIQSYLRKQEKSQMNNLTLHLKQLEEEGQTKPKVSRREEIREIRAEINEIEKKKTIEKNQ